MKSSRKRKQKIRKRIAVLLAALVILIPSTSAAAYSIAVYGGCWTTYTNIWPFASWGRQTTFADYFYVRSSHRCYAYAGEGSYKWGYAGRNAHANKSAYGPFGARVASDYFNY
ncbi:MAG: hypothetical protein LBI43_07920 [Streptococcaceae bacterium]|jgi:hypothetical protein|nr:hypothetical protein [Streptococcaceae bacterium]